MGLSPVGRGRALARGGPAKPGGVGGAESGWAGRGRGVGGPRREDGAVCAAERGSRSVGAVQAVSSGSQSPPRGEGGGQSGPRRLHGPAL